MRYHGGLMKITAALAIFGGGIGSLFLIPYYKPLGSAHVYVSLLMLPAVPAALAFFLKGVFYRWIFPAACGQRSCNGAARPKDVFGYFYRCGWCGRTWDSSLYERSAIWPVLAFGTIFALSGAWLSQERPPFTTTPRTRWKSSPGLTRQVTMDEPPSPVGRIRHFESRTMSQCGGTSASSDRGRRGRGPSARS